MVFRSSLSACGKRACGACRDAFRWPLWWYTRRLGGSDKSLPNNKFLDHMAKSPDPPIILIHSDDFALIDRLLAAADVRDESLSARSSVLSGRRRAGPRNSAPSYSINTQPEDSPSVAQSRRASFGPSVPESSPARSVAVPRAASRCSIRWSVAIGFFQPAG